MLAVDVVTKVGLEVEVTNGRHALHADEPREAGGTDRGLRPTELLLASLGSCTAITLRMYADRKGWPLERVRIRLTLERPAPGAADPTQRIRQALVFEGPLDEAQRARLLQISGRCPVHRVLDGPLEITEREASAP